MSYDGVNFCHRVGWPYFGAIFLGFTWPIHFFSPSLLVKRRVSDFLVSKSFAMSLWHCASFSYLSVECLPCSWGSPVCVTFAVRLLFWLLHFSSLSRRHFFSLFLFSFPHSSMFDNDIRCLTYLSIYSCYLPMMCSAAVSLNPLYGVLTFLIVHHDGSRSL